MPLSTSIEAAFAQQPVLSQRIDHTNCMRAQFPTMPVTDSPIARFPELKGLFEDIARYILDLQNGVKIDLGNNQNEPQSKKRKLEHRPTDSAGWDKGIQYSIADVSFSIPQRKKFTLELNPSIGLRATSAIGGAVTTECSINWDSVWDIFCLPLPEKAQAQYNFCVFSASSSDQVLWTVPNTAPKEGVVKGASVAQDDTYRTLLISMINESLRPYKKHVIEPDKNEFASQIAQAHRKGETAFHVKAFRGSKDGYLFFLSTGILWGFKKPLEFFAFDAIESVSYTSVLQRTFNLNIAVRPSDEADLQEFEFSMVDQADFAGIDHYIKRHELQDASMAEQRRAKKLNINKVKGQNVPEEDEEQGEGELEKARREAEDLEEEEEEDENFDPGSEGESEGSGSSSEEDDQNREGGSGGNLVEDELGSEAESAEE